MNEKFLKSRYINTKILPKCFDLFEGITTSIRIETKYLHKNAQKSKKSSQKRRNWYKIVKLLGQVKKTKFPVSSYYHIYG